MSRTAVEPKCEICGTGRAIIFAPISGGYYPSEGVSNDWKFLCKKCNTQEYFLFISDYFQNQRQTSDWVQHLNDKNWFDRTDFGDMILRYIKEAESGNGI
jgi:hypothetical protein